MYIDTHCHLDSESYDNVDEIIKKVGENVLIISGTNDKTNKEVLNLCNNYNNIFGCLGIHPSEIDNNIDDSLDFIEKNINNPKIVGIGEIGLDYYWDKENKDQQKKVFIRQINLAKKYNKTIVIHSRDAALDTMTILKDTNINNCKVVMHCYSYSLELARELVKLGVKLGIGGVLTFKNSAKLKEIVKELSLDNFLLETDSPYLTPEPFRGKKNEPSYVIYVAKKMAEIKDISLEEVLNKTTLNAVDQFDLKVYM